MNIQQLIDVQLRLECKRLNTDGLLERIPCLDPDDIPRCYALRHVGGCTVYCRHDLSEHIRKQITMLAPEQAFSDEETIKRILAQEAPAELAWAGKSYFFPVLPRQEVFPDAIQLKSEMGARTTYAVVVDHHIVATCESSRENESAAEAWVQTLPEFRRRGYARQAVSAWAYALLSQGKIAFYSHKLDNFASQAVARSLGLVQFIEGKAYS